MQESGTDRYVPNVAVYDAVIATIGEYYVCGTGFGLILESWLSSVIDGHMLADVIEQLDLADLNRACGRLYTLLVERHAPILTELMPLHEYAANACTCVFRHLLPGGQVFIEVN